MNNQEDLQRLLKKEYLIGPEFKMKEKIGINYYSGNKSSAFYELWGKDEIFQIIIVQPSSNLFAGKFVGKNHILFLLVVENDQMIGGFLSLQEDILTQLDNLFTSITPNSIKQLVELWNDYVLEHYNGLNF